ncbi:MAG: hypothetical protein ACI4J7_03960 [Ruminiclostridium sp.]
MLAKYHEDNEIMTSERLDLKTKPDCPTVQGSSPCVCENFFDRTDFSFIRITKNKKRTIA